jgi:hypothetical protein
MDQIISVISPKAHIPPELAQKIKASGIGMTLKWAPQQTIFSHPVRVTVVNIRRIYSPYLVMSIGHRLGHNTLWTKHRDGSAGRRFTDVSNVFHPVV